jgi:hypothetical protein
MVGCDACVFWGGGGRAYVRDGVWGVWGGEGVHPNPQSFD